MSLLALFPGAKLVAKSTALTRIEQKSEALHNRFMPVSIHDEDVDYDAPQSRGAKIVEQFREQIKKGTPISISPQALRGLVDALKNSKGIDDRKMLLEHVLVFMSRLPDGPLAQELQNLVIELLYFDLPHPPASYMGKYQFRSADGSGNNVSIPDMGKAGTPYSRSVQASHALLASDLPDPELVYQSLLRRDKFVPHPGGLSSLMFGFATLVIHSIFRTSFNPSDWSINETSSYIDLAPLYGNNQETQDSVRLKESGKGLLKPDTFAEDRLLLLPPASAVILVLFNRNHNYIANKIFEINERGWYKDPATLASGVKAQQDEELFQTTRLVNCMWFAQVVFSDYFATILGLVREGSSWNLNPFELIRKPDHTMVERGQGNSVSIEFNILYRWHVTMSVDNVEWTEHTFQKVFKDVPWNKMSVQDFAKGMRAVQAEENKDPAQWNFGNIERREDTHCFKDADLAKILQDATSEPASAFKARGSPEVMRIIEIMGMEQARKWGACSLNDFRRFLQLKPYADFEDWNEDPDVAETARRLYGNIENLELYAGLQAEQPKPKVPGAGLCPAYTTSRAILADAISLCRGDRFYTADLTPWNLTAWGFQDCQRDTTNGGFGSMFGRLLLRTLPEHYSYNSVYTWYGFMTPEAMEENLTNIGIAKNYSFTRPDHSEHPHPVNTFSGVSAILKERTVFRDSYVARAKELIPGRGYLLSLDDPDAHKVDSQLVTASFAGDVQAVAKAAQFYFRTTKELVEDRSYTLNNIPGRSIDIVGEVLNFVPLHFVSSKLAGFPLKTKQNPWGTYMERELLQMLRDIFAYIFFEADPAKKMRAQQIAKTHTDELLRHINNHLKEASPDLLHDILHFFHHPNKDEESLEFVKKLSASKKPRDELANDILSLVLLSSVELSQALVHIVNLYLEGHHAEHRKAISALATTPGAEADAQLLGYVREALRVDPSIRGAYRHVQKDSTVDGVIVTKHKHVFLSFANANLDPDIFVNPSQIDPARPAEGYLSMNDTIYGALGNNFVEKMAAQVLRAVFSLKNLRRAPGAAGTLKRVVTVTNGTANYQYLDVNHNLSPWARSMIVQYDE